VAGRARSRHDPSAYSPARASRGSASTSFHSSIAASGVGSVSVICMTIGRQAICGYTSPGSSPPRLTVRIAAPGLSARVTSAVQVTGIPYRTARAENSLTNIPGPIEICMIPWPADPSTAAIAATSSTSANRLGTGRP